MEYCRLTDKARKTLEEVRYALRPDVDYISAETLRWASGKLLKMCEDATDSVPRGTPVRR